MTPTPQPVEMKRCPECEGCWIPAAYLRCLICESVLVHGFNVFAFPVPV